MYVLGYVYIYTFEHNHVPLDMAQFGCKHCGQIGCQHVDHIPRDMYIHTYIYICTCTYLYTHMHICTYVDPPACGPIQVRTMCANWVSNCLLHPIYTHIYVCMYACMHAFLCKHVHANDLYTCMHVCIFVCNVL